MHVFFAFAPQKKCCEYVYNTYDTTPQSTSGELILFDSTKIYILFRSQYLEIFLKKECII